MTHALVLGQVYQYMCVEVAILFVLMFCKKRFSSQQITIKPAVQWL